MELKVYRCHFTEDMTDNSRKSLVPDPTTRMDVEYDEDMGYVVCTHDRGNDGKSARYYSPVFRIEAPNKDEWKLYVLGSTPERDKLLVYDERSDLWYAKTKKKRGNFETDIDATRTAGVFTIEARHANEDPQCLTVIVQPSVFSIDEYRYMLKRMAATHDRMIMHDRNRVGIGMRETHDALQSGSPAHDIDLWNRMKPSVLRIMEMPATLLKSERQDLPLRKIRHFDQRTMRGILTNPGEGKVPGMVYRDDHDTLENRAIKAVLTRCSHSVLNYEDTHCPDDNEIEQRVIRDWNREHPDATPGKTLAQNVQESVRSFAQVRGQHSSPVELKTVLTPLRNQREVSRSGNMRHHVIRFDIDESNGQITISTMGYADVKRLVGKESKSDGQSPMCNSGQPGADNKELSSFVHYPFRYQWTPCALELRTHSLRVAFNALRNLIALYDGSMSSDESRPSFSIMGKDQPTCISFEDKYHLPSGEKTVKLLICENVTDCTYAPQESEEEPRTRLELLRRLWQLTSLSTEGHSHNLRGIEFQIGFCNGNPGFREEFDFVGFCERRRRMYRKRFGELREMRRASRELQEILETPWFRAITDVGIASVPSTPRFLQDPLYRKVYQCAHTLLGTHPSCSFFDPYEFGIHRMHLIYEYWVLFELLDRLLNLGFVAEGQEARATCGELLHGFIEANKGKKPEGIAIPMVRRMPAFNAAGACTNEQGEIKVVLGFNCRIGTSGKGNSLVPDYFLRVMQTYKGVQTDHWYFLDAKCMTYENRAELWNSEKAVLSDKTIHDVCLLKYLNRMEKEGFLKTYLGAKDDEATCKIRGAYLLVAEVRNDDRPPAGDADAFFGSPKHCDDSEDTKRLAHRYGAAVVRPVLFSQEGREVAGADDLTTLLKLIFEYREGAELLEPYYSEDEHGRQDAHGQGAQRDAKGSIFETIHREGKIEELPLTLHGCWNSAVDHAGMAPPTTTRESSGGRYAKFYVTCPCGDLRVENYCGDATCRREIYKHDVGNYHYPVSKGSKWGFVCPHCGDRLDGETTAWSPESDEGQAQNQAGREHPGVIGYTGRYDDDLF